MIILRKPRPIGALACTFLFAVACGGGGEESGAERPAAPAAGSPSGGDTTAMAPTGTASVSGSVTYEGAIPNLRPLAMNADPGCAAKHDEPVLPPVLLLGDGNTLGNVLVTVANGLPEGAYPLPREEPVLDQRGCMYRPHVLGVRAGQPLKILNSDGLLHNIHSLPDKNLSFNRAMPASVTETTFTVSQPEGPFKVKCDVHPWMEAWIAVFEGPHFQVTGEDGRFLLSGLPAGTYEIEAWHEKLGSQSQSVTVEDGGTATVDFVFQRSG